MLQAFVRQTLLETSSHVLEATVSSLQTVCLFSGADSYLGAILGTQMCCALIEVLMAFTPPRILKKIFPPLVTGPTVTLIGINLIRTGFQNWAGGSGTCASRPTTGNFMLCPSNSAPHALPWGSAEFIGLGFLVFVTIIFAERFGSPIMKSCSVVVGLLMGCIVAAACGYFSASGINSAPAVSFIWVHTVISVIDSDNGYANTFPVPTLCLRSYSFTFASSVHRPCHGGNR